MTLPRFIRIQTLAEPIRNYRANQILKSFNTGFIQPGETMLSVGDGDGYVSLRLQEKTGVKIKGLDILFHKDYRVQGIPLVLYDGKEIPFQKNTFDIVAGIFVLHHCKDLEFTLEEMIRVTKKKLIIVEDIFNNSLERNFLRFFDIIENRTFSPNMPIPFNYRTLVQWRQIFSHYNLKLICSTQYQALPLPVRNQTFCLIKG